MRKVCVFTGSRANYSSCKSIMRAVQKHPALELQVVLGGAAVLDRYGNIETLVKADGFEVDAKFYMIVEGENPITMAKSTGLGVIELSMIFNNLQPDLVVVVGDRFDIMAPAIAASYMNIPIAHTMGGEVSGTIDESIRHAVTKLAHLHFPANEDARERIIRMGESPETVHNVGCPRMDLVKEIVEAHHEGPPLDQEWLYANFKGVGGRFDIQREAFLLVSQHPVTTEFGENRRHMEETLAALERLGKPTIMIWPNADAGSDEVSKAIRTFRERVRPEWLHLFINLPIDVYIRLMASCACVVGNSSSAVREGAFMGAPAVNIGTRQAGRLRGTNLVDVDYDRDQIHDAILERMQNREIAPDTIYGDGQAGERIAALIAGTERIDPQKRICY